MLQAELTFLVPSLLAASIAAAAPILIHLFLRDAPRRIVFPAIQFVRKTHKAQVNRHRLKHLILLAMRMAAIVLCAMLLARMARVGYGGLIAGEPVTAVLILDNSGSMNYRQGGIPRLASAKTQATQLVAKLPAGSRVAVLTTAQPGAAANFLSDTKLAAQQISDVSASFGNDSLGPVLKRACALLGSEPEGGKAIYVFTDMTAQAWRDVQNEDAPQPVTVIDVSAGRLTNLSLGDVELSSTYVPLGSTVGAAAMLTGLGMSGEFTLATEMDGRAVDQRCLRVSETAATGFNQPLRPLREGIVQGQLVVAQSDNLDLDNTRYFTLDVHAPPRVLVVRDAANIGRDDPAAFVLSTALAPQNGSGAVRSLSNERLDESSLDGMAAVILANVSALTPTQWAALDKYVRSGGWLWVVAGDLVSPTSYNSPQAQRLMPASLGPVDRPAKALKWRVERSDDPLLSPFADGHNPPLSDVRCASRLALGPLAEDARALVRFTDNAPAMSIRKVGSGWTLLWNFSPAPQWSNLAQLPQLPILAQRTLRQVRNSPELPLLYRFGEPVVLALPAEMNAPRVLVQPPGQSRPFPLLPDLRTRCVSLSPDRLGNWTVQFSEDKRSWNTGFSVNAPSAESDLREMPAPKAVVNFPPGQCVVLRASDEADLLRVGGRRTSELAGPILLVLLALLIAESFLSNRFYRTPASQNDPPQPPRP